jgi:hypothetical protein
MEAAAAHVDLALLSIWTGAWMARAGILAEMCSFPLLAPEILGAERLKRAEEAMRRGVASPSVQRGAAAVWVALFLLVFIAITLLMWMLPILSGPEIFLPVALIVLGSGFAGAFSSNTCRVVVRNRLRKQKLLVDGDALFVAQGEMAQASRAVLNPLEFRRVMKPVLWEWVLWAFGIPFHVIAFVGYFIIPKGVLALVHLQRRLLASGVGLRSLVVGTGIVLFFGGMSAQLMATF